MSRLSLLLPLLMLMVRLFTVSASSDSPLTCFSPSYCASLSYNSTASSVTFTLRVATEGWMALLFGPEIDGMTRGSGYDFLFDPLTGQLNDMKPFHFGGHGPPIYDAKQLAQPTFTGRRYPELGISWVQFTQPLRLLSSAVCESPDSNLSPLSMQCFDFGLYAYPNAKLGGSWAFGSEQKLTKHAPGHKGQFIASVLDSTIEAADDPDYFTFYFYPIFIGIVVFIAFRWSTTCRLFRSSFPGVYELLYHKPLAFSSEASSSPVKLFHLLTFDMFPTLSNLVLAELLMILLYIAMILSFIYLGYSSFTSFPSRTWWPIFGHLLLWHIPFTLIPTSKHSFLLRLFGIPFERAIQVHRWCARTTLIYGLVHLLTELHNYTDRILFLLVPYHLENGAEYGFLAFLTMSGMAVFAWEPIRRYAFEIFWYLHLAAAPAVVTLVCLHVKIAWKVFLPVIILYGIDQLVIFYQLWIAHSNWRVTQLDVMTDDRDTNFKVTKMRISVPANAGQPSNFSFQPGQYSYYHLFPVSWFEFHPFSFASSPTQYRHTGSFEVFTLSMGKPRGPFTCWTRKLADRAEPFSQSTAASASASHSLLSPSIPWQPRVYGPFGHFSFDPRDCQHLFLFAGGIGITPFLSLIDEIACNPSWRALNQRITLVWAAKSRRFINFVGSSVLNRALSALGTRLELLMFANERVSDEEAGRPQENDSELNAKIVCKRMDIDQVFKRLIRSQTEPIEVADWSDSVPLAKIHPAGSLNEESRGSLHSRKSSHMLASHSHSTGEASLVHPPPRFHGVLCCGPDRLVDEVQNRFSRSLGQPDGPSDTQKVHWLFHRETFRL